MVLPKHTQYHSLATMLLETISMVSSMIYNFFRIMVLLSWIPTCQFTVWLSRGLLLLVCIITLSFVQEISQWQLLLDDLLKNSATNFENEEDLSLSNWAGESYSTILPVLSKISALISSNHSQLNLILSTSIVLIYVFRILIHFWIFILSEIK